MGTFSKQSRDNMQSVDAARTTAFSEVSIEEVDVGAFSELEQIDERIALIESFTQPFPLRERDRPVIDGEMDAYG
jgi:hypothetical protein